ncbi:esterase/lipase family protein [Thioflexithrix psekupsensis]|uniref:GPI inositol-deacylase PGAP1-like alpha/beta domain-containing protein n=1 Tax=Thioflexithrix psekupsensis TaxID=1570016 RepID=A0A251XB67_9GAMM|nr:hypothetical protein [Thioflexithrix psekupsensis]OUD15340.1 hypothetical protein TPSD3_02080 [Thioflexithrix psekupsensis]
MLSPSLTRFTLLLALSAFSVTVKAQLPFPFAPTNTPQNCQALYYPNTGLLKLPCLVIEPNHLPSYEVRLRFAETNGTTGFLVEELLNGQVDTQLPENATCLSRYMPSSGELFLPCLNVPDAMDLGYSATLQLNPNLMGAFFGVNHIEARLAPTSSPSPTEPKPEPTPPATPTQPAPTISPLNVRIVFVGAGKGSVTLENHTCQQDCTLSVPRSETLQLSAVPAAGSELVGWSSNCSVDASKEWCQVSQNDISGDVLVLTVDFRPAAREARAIVLLHGMNSDELTWDNYLDQHDQFDVDNCPVVFDGVLTQPSLLSSRQTPPELGCFRVRFGAYDGFSGRIGLENMRTSGVEKGDFSTFDQLGQEVADAVTALQQAYKRYYGENVVLKVALVGHSRGGLAARAFLQNDNIADSTKTAVAALLTTGTPHNGSPLGRIYGYLERNCLSNNVTRLGDWGFFSNDACYDDWQVVDTLRFGQCNGFKVADETLDVRKPTVADLSDNSTPIRTLDGNVNKLPKAVRYGSLRYSGVELGKLTELYRIFDLAGPDICDQVSRDAQYVILEGSQPTASHLIGDGIVPYLNQAFPAGIVSYDGNPKNGVYHTKQPKEEIHITNGLKELLPHW